MAKSQHKESKDEKDKDALVGRIRKVVKKSRRKLGEEKFEKELQRTISVDIRYVLWVIDKYAGAKNLVDEMTLVTHPKEVAPVTTPAPLEEVVPVKGAVKPVAPKPVRKVPAKKG